jgi:hypothetical protein
MPTGWHHQTRHDPIFAVEHRELEICSSKVDADRAGLRAHQLSTGFEITQHGSGTRSFTFDVQHACTAMKHVPHCRMGQSDLIPRGAEK